MTNLLIKTFVKNPTQVNNADVRHSYGKLSGYMGIVLNIFLFGGKILSGILTGSIAIIADAFNNLSDIGTSVITLVSFKIANSPADKEHPFGHGRMEYLFGLIVSILITLVGVELVRSSVIKIFHSENLELSFLPLIILIISIFVKLWMGLFTRKLGIIINSPIMKASAYDSIVDAVSTTAAIFSLVIFYFFKINIDGIIGVIVAVFIFYTGIKTARESVSQIVGMPPDKEFVKNVENMVISYENILGVHDLIVHNYGVGISMITLHAEVPREMDFSSAHELIDEIEKNLREKFKCHATIHMDPVAISDKETMRIKKIVAAIVKTIDPELSIHDFRKTNGINNENLIFDVAVPFKFRLSDEQIKKSLTQAMNEIDNRYCLIINIDKMII